jgi:hypothetical protein
VKVRVEGTGIVVGDFLTSVERNHIKDYLVQ